MLTLKYWEPDPLSQRSVLRLAELPDADSKQRRLPGTRHTWESCTSCGTSGALPCSALAFLSSAAMLTADLGKTGNQF